MPRYPLLIPACLGAELHAQQCLSLLCHPQLLDDDVAKVVDTVNHRLIKLGRRRILRIVARPRSPF